MKRVQKNLGKIYSEIDKYGISRKVEKHCPECGKVWQADLNTSNFFVSALLPV
jgi:hypothetical protein